MPDLSTDPMDLLELYAALRESAPELVRAAYDQGHLKLDIHRRTGLGRTTIDAYLRLTDDD